MLIRVRYQDNRYDMVRPELLDHLLETGVVRAFKRSSGWVDGNDPSVRRKKSVLFHGQEQRQQPRVRYHR